jgi:phosphoribosyl 1,2-cyclic phosphodiesterase
VITFSLQSGSNGNAIYVETADARLLFDCGLTGKKALDRMAVHGRHPRDLTAVVVSHDHRDHVRGIGVLARRWRVPVLATTGTCEVLPRKGVGWIPDLRTFSAGERLRFGRTVVETVPTPHDGLDGVAFVVEADGVRLGIFTDLGHLFPGLDEALGETDVSYVESNYDAVMLETGAYPLHLKDRIRGPGGHISNEEAAALLRGSSGGRLGLAVLSHLSQENNRPEIAHETVRTSGPPELELRLAGRYGASDLFHVLPR